MMRSEKNLLVPGTAGRPMAVDIFAEEGKGPLPVVIYAHGFNGFKDWDVIGNMFSIWTLERIKDEYEKCEDKNFIPFCDYLIDSHRIGYLKNQSKVFKDFDQLNPIANSFEDTIRLIIEDSKLLY